MSSEDGAGLCITCKFWGGDRSVDSRREFCFSPNGRCSELHELELEVHCGEYCLGGEVLNYTPAWFGCVMYKEIEDDE